MLERERLDRDNLESVTNEAIVRAQEKLSEKPGEAARWRRAIEKAYAYLTDPATVWYLTDDDTLLIVSPQSSHLYEVNGRDCQIVRLFGSDGHKDIDEAPRGVCAAADRGIPCWHVAAGRLLALFCAEPIQID